jgi:hypothetical protein
VTIDIAPAGSGNGENAVNYNNSINKVGTDSQVHLDLQANPQILTRDPATGNAVRKSRPAKIGFVHEFIHAEHAIRGASSPRDTLDTFAYKDASGALVQQTKRLEELRTVGLKGVGAKDITENQIRREQKVPPRAAY